MLLNYIKIAIRNLLKKKVFTIINVLGLSVGAASSLIIFLYVQVELSYDEFLPDSDRLYRVVEDRIYPDRLSHFAVMPGGFSTIFPQEIPEIEASTRLVGFPDFATVVRYKDNIFSERYFFAADSNFFDVVPFKLLKGNAKKILNHANTIILTASTATKYFGTEDPMGKMIKVNNQDHEVVGIMEDIPDNSHMKFDALFPALSIGFLREPNFYIAGTFTYVRLARGADPKVVESKIPALVDKYAASQIERDQGVSYKKYVADGNGYRYFLQAIGDIHLTSNRSSEIKGNGSEATVKVLSFIGLLILAIAGINFVNLATARSAERAREVGVRKVLGSRRQQLMLQFLSESLLISTLSIVLAIVIIQLLLGYFNSFSQTKLELDFVQNPILIIAVLVVTLALGLIAGLYPAFMISTLRPVNVLKGKFQTSSGGVALRNGLVVFQFTVSIILISATLVVYDQLDFMQNKSLGFGKENLLVITHNSNGEESAALQQELGNLPGVRSVGASNSVPGGYFFGTIFKVQGSEEAYTPKGMTMDDNFVSAMDLKIIDGRVFSPEFDDSLNVVINRKAAEVMNLKNPVGTILANNDDNNRSVRYTVVGVVEDFNFESLRTAISPLVIMSTEGQFNFQNVIIARLDGDVTPTLNGIEAKWKELVPNEPFVYSFMENRWDNLYKSENNSSRLLITFTLIAIVIACVGLFGLAAYTAHQRTKEIGVRKVLGATVISIIALLYRDFFKLVLIALLLGAPVAWFLARRWLESFAYRVPLDVMTFLSAGLIVLILTAMTICYQAISASVANPANSLKEE